jgi:hypothetical protein
VGLAEHQRFTTRTIHRSQLQNAPYNPRLIDKHARGKLRDKLAEIGLVTTLIWNERTGNLVGGHQRLDVLDELEGRSDYHLTVAVVDLDDRAEREMNVFLNNRSAMGQWDAEALTKLVATSDAKIEEMGFDPADIQLLFETADLSSLFSDAKGETLAKEADWFEQAYEMRKDHKRGSDDQYDAEFYAVVVFATTAEREEFLHRAGCARAERAIDGKILADLGGLDFTSTQS